MIGSELLRPAIVVALAIGSAAAVATAHAQGPAAVSATSGVVYCIQYPDSLPDSLAAHLPRVFGLVQPAAGARGGRAVWRPQAPEAAAKAVPRRGSWRRLDADSVHIRVADPTSVYEVRAFVFGGRLSGTLSVSRARSAAKMQVVIIGRRC